MARRIYWLCWSALAIGLLVGARASASEPTAPDQGVSKVLIAEPNELYRAGY